MDVAAWATSVVSAVDGELASSVEPALKASPYTYLPTSCGFGTYTYSPPFVLLHMYAYICAFAYAYHHNVHAVELWY